MSEEDKVIHVSDRLRDGHEVKTDEDHQQWIYEYFDNISRDFGLDMTPIQLFPPMTRVMVEWVEAISGMSGGSIGRRRKLSRTVSVNCRTA
jgi:hypothetical protein